MSHALLLAALLAAGDATPVQYRVVPDFQAGTFAVTATFPRAEAGELEFWMPRWTAGAYHLAGYGRFVKQLKATDSSGAERAVARDGDDRFVVAAGAKGPVTISWSAEVCAPKSTNSRMILDVEGNRLLATYGYLSPNSL